MSISITTHNANAHEVTVGDRTWYFSYRTCVAFIERATEQLYPMTEKSIDVLVHARRIRRESNYSPTTAKHMNYMGVADWPKVDDATFERLAGRE